MGRLHGNCLSDGYNLAKESSRGVIIVIVEWSEMSPFFAFHSTYRRGKYFPRQVQVAVEISPLHYDEMQLGKGSYTFANIVSAALYSSIYVGTHN